MKLARRLASAGAAVLLPAVQPVMLGGAMTALVNFFIENPVAAQSAESAAKVAIAITVRIEGATQGSGVLIKRNGNRYTVLTAWHVVSGQRQGEELAVYTSDGRAHAVDSGTIQQVGNKDMASLIFQSDIDYTISRLSSGRDIAIGSKIFVAGFPLPTTAVPSRLFRFLEGISIGIDEKGAASGYDLLYSNPTLPGMSGGPVLDSTGRVVGIHGRAETDSQLTEQAGVAVKTGTNQGMTIDQYIQTFKNQESIQANPATSQEIISSKPKQKEIDFAKNNEAYTDSMADLILSAAVNSCELAVEHRMPVQSSLISGARAVTYAITNSWVGTAGQPQKPEPSQIMNSTIGYVAASVMYGCGKKLGQQDRMFLESIK